MLPRILAPGYRARAPAARVTPGMIELRPISRSSRDRRASLGEDRRSERPGRGGGPEESGPRLGRTGVRDRCRCSSGPQIDRPGARRQPRPAANRYAPDPGRTGRGPRRGRPTYRRADTGRCRCRGRRPRSVRMDERLPSLRRSRRELRMSPCRPPPPPTAGGASAGVTSRGEASRRMAEEGVQRGRSPHRAGRGGQRAIFGPADICPGIDKRWRPW